MGEDRLKIFGDIEINNIMVKNPLYTTPDEKISATELYMLRKKVNGLPVVKNHQQKILLGIITQRDIRLARFAISLESSNTTVKDLMTPNPYTIKKTDSIKNALKIMEDNNIERLPVVDENNELVGLLLEKSIIKKLNEYLR
jgi:CBS domain-containing protein